MKKIIFWAIMGAAGMVSCTNNETLEISEGRAISFKNAVVTKAATALENGTFSIYAFKGTAGTHPSAMTYTDVYTLATDKYGDSADKMYYYDGVNSYWFYGYAATNTITTTAATAFAANPTGVTFNVGTTPSLDFNAAAGDVDLVVMGTGEKTTGTQQNPQMPITFYHALSRVRFTAKTQTHEPTLSQIKITGITFTTSKDACNVTGFGPAKSNVNVTATGSTAGSYVLTGNFQTELTTTAQKVETTDKVFFVVPQQLSATSLIVNYTVGGVARAKTFDLSSLTLLAGSSYNFEIIINLNEITFNASLEDWAETTNTYTEGLITP